MPLTLLPALRIQKDIYTSVEGSCFGLAHSDTCKIIECRIFLHDLCPSQNKQTKKSAGEWRSKVLNFAAQCADRSCF